jgi:NDP-sugar pyrophosphorylase family protein
VGDGCHIAEEAVVTELSVLGCGVQAAKRSRIEQSVVWDNTRIEEGAQLSQCVVGRDCQIGKYARLAPGTVLGDGAVIPAYSQV